MRHISEWLAALPVETEPEMDRHQNWVHLNPPWAEYERRKALLIDQDLPPSDYQEGCKRIAAELGI
jgi:hypothetical protein